ncbi:hypothetical protein FG379_000560 [Cryptosporidium bovis]|uniref:uncharacterized protein n=1 Tax=Cryptosporidium bovis TaxID=310047 RepID=UPI003519EA20|nr:hypothetical protein FG379_000560 [Cryptosporidium bovis]
MGASQSKDLGGFRVCNYGETSLGKFLGFERYFDYIVGIDGVPLTQISDASHDFFVKRLKGVARSKLKISVYNSLSSKIRTFVLIPSNKFDEISSKADTETNGTKLSKKHENKTEKQTDDSDEIKLQLNHDIPFESQKIFQFLNFDERINGLGIGVHWEEISKKGIKVINVQNSSPAELSGMTPNNDYIIGSNSIKRPFYSTDDFLAYIKNNDGSEVSLSVYNSETEILREISITPNSSWGGRGFLGCDITAGPMVDIPFREKSSVNKCAKEITTDPSNSDNKHTNLSLSHSNSPIEPNFIYTSFDKNTNKISYKLENLAENTADIGKIYFKEDCNKPKQDVIECDNQESNMVEKEIELENELNIEVENNANLESYTNLEVKIDKELTLKNDGRYILCEDSHFTERSLIRDNSFDLFRVKQTNNIIQDRRAIIEKAIIDDFKHIEDLEDQSVNVNTRNNCGFAKNDINSPEDYINTSNLSVSNTQENITLESFHEENGNMEQELTPSLVAQNQVLVEVITPTEPEKCSEKEVKEDQDVTYSIHNNIDTYMHTPEFVGNLNTGNHTNNENMHACAHTNSINENAKEENDERKSLSNETIKLAEGRIKEYESRENGSETDTPRQVMTPISEREYEIFKKLLEIKPVIGYNPPGTLEVSEETDKY